MPSTNRQKWPVPKLAGLVAPELPLAALVGEQLDLNLAARDSDHRDVERGRLRDADDLADLGLLVQPSPQQLQPEPVAVELE